MAYFLLFTLSETEGNITSCKIRMGIMTYNQNIKRVVSITSGKGGVGKTTIVYNLASALNEMGIKVLILDADLALGNIDLFAGIRPLFTLRDVINGQKKLDEIVIDAGNGIKIIPTSSGDQDMIFLNEEQKINLISEFDNFKNCFDILLIDTDAGISSNVIYFATISQEISVVITPDPASLHDALALINILSNKYGEKSFNVIANCARNEKEGKQLFIDFADMVDKKCNVSLNYLGTVAFDAKLIEAVQKQKAVCEIFPDTVSSKEFKKMSKVLMDLPNKPFPKGNLQLLLRNSLEQSKQRFTKI